MPCPRALLSLCPLAACPPVPLMLSHPLSLFLPGHLSIHPLCFSLSVCPPIPISCPYLAICLSPSLASPCLCFSICPSISFSLYLPIRLSLCPLSLPVHPSTYPHLPSLAVPPSIPRGSLSPPLTCPSLHPSPHPSPPTRPVRLSVCLSLSAPVSLSPPDFTAVVPETPRLDSSLQKARARLLAKSRRQRPSRSRLRDSASSTEGDEGPEAAVSGFGRPRLGRERGRGQPRGHGGLTPPCRVSPGSRGGWWPPSPLALLPRRRVLLRGGGGAAGAGGAPRPLAPPQPLPAPDGRLVPRGVGGPPLAQVLPQLRQLARLRPAPAAQRR